MVIDPGSLKAAFESLRFAGQLVKTIISEHDASVVKEKARELTGVIIEAQSQTLDAQTQLSQANEEIRDLKDRLAKMEKWEQEKQRYELVQPAQSAPGIFVYQLKESERGTEPVHPVCTKCFHEGRAQILQQDTVITPNGFFTRLVCPGCETELVTSGMRPEMPRGRR